MPINGISKYIKQKLIEVKEEIDKLYHTHTQSLQLYWGV